MVEHQSERGHRSRVPTIRELIQDAIDSGKSVRDLSAASGDRVKHQTFQELSKRAPKQFPKESKTISGMSAALGYPEATIVLAYAKGLGISVETDSQFALRLPYGVDGLDPEMQSALVSVARAAVNQIGVTNDLTTQAPPTPSSTEAEGENIRAGDARDQPSVADAPAVDHSEDWRADKAARRAAARRVGEASQEQGEVR